MSSRMHTATHTDIFSAHAKRHILSIRGIRTCGQAAAGRQYTRQARGPLQHWCAPTVPVSSQTTASPTFSYVALFHSVRSLIQWPRSLPHPTAC